MLANLHPWYLFAVNRRKNHERMLSCFVVNTGVVHIKKRAAFFRCNGQSARIVSILQRFARHFNGCGAIHLRRPGARHFGKATTKCFSVGFNTGREALYIGFYVAYAHAAALAGFEGDKARRVAVWHHGQALAFRLVSHSFAQVVILRHDLRRLLAYWPMTLPGRRFFNLGLFRVLGLEAPWFIQLALVFNGQQST